jgi:hypothetical protein
MGDFHGVVFFFRAKVSPRLGKMAKEVSQFNSCGSGPLGGHHSQIA